MGLSCEPTQRLGTPPRLQSKRRSNASKVRVCYLMGFESGLRPVCATICVASIKPIHADSEVFRHFLRSRMAHRNKRNFEAFALLELMPWDRTKSPVARIGWIRFEITAKAEQSVGDHDLITLQAPRTTIR